jgi:predicted Fe-Mo cluster-binding NifX family protein/ferredoxin
MKIAVTSTGGDLDSQVEPRFGRCPYFLIVDSETFAFEALENPNVALGGGAGIQSAQLLANSGAQTVLTGNCGPNAFATLGAAEIQVIVGVSGVVRQAVEQFKQGAFSGAVEPNVASHFGMAAADQSGASGTPTMPMGGGAGGGRGMGMGGGRGMGRGMGMGGGRGMGMGGGAMAVPPTGASTPAGAMPQQTGGQFSPEQELQALKSQAQQLETQLQSTNAQINKIEHGGRILDLIAVVDAEKCTACVLCVEVCPADAISLDDIAQIDREKCTGCGQCVAECPQDALSLKKV